MNALFHPRRVSHRGPYVWAMRLLFMGLIGGPIGGPIGSRSATASPLDRTVVLHNGEVVRGRLIAEVPGQFLLLQIGAQSRRIPWAEIWPAADEEPVNLNHVPVAVNGDPRMTVASRSEQPGKSADWVSLCTLPCRERLPRQDVYRLTGPGLMSAEFKLPPVGARVVVDVRAGHRSMVAAGAIMIVVGGLAGVGGLGYLLATLFTEYKIGAPLFATGVPILIVGAVLTDRGQTNVEVRAEPRTSSALGIRLGRAVYLSSQGLVF